MLPCVCSVIDHRWRQNVVRTKKWHTRRQPSVSLMFLPHFDVFCDLLLNRRTATWNLFVLYNKETKIKKSVFISKEDTKQGRDGFFRARKKWFDVICYLYKMEQTDWFLGAATNCDWLGKSRHSQKLIEKFAFRGTKHHSESSNSFRKSSNVLQNTAKI